MHASCAHLNINIEGPAAAGSGSVTKKKTPSSTSLRNGFHGLTVTFDGKKRFDFPHRPHDGVVGLFKRLNFSSSVRGVQQSKVYCVACLELLTQDVCDILRVDCV
jgi:hypothetical protein